MPFRRAIVSAALVKEVASFKNKIARLSIPVSQKMRLTSSSAESRRMSLKAHDRVKNGVKIVKSLNKQTS